MPGIRAEYINTAANGSYVQQVKDAAGNVVVQEQVFEQQYRSRAFIIAGLGVSYQPHEQLKFYGNFSQNYRAINFSDMRVVNPNFRIDPNIRDERGFSADLGVQTQLGKVLRAELTAFWLKYNGKIGQVLRAGEAPLYLDYRYRTNLANANNLGLELFAEMQLGELLGWPHHRKLSWFVNGSAISARYNAPADPTVDGRQVEMVPPLMLRSGLELRVQNFSSALQFGHTARHYTDATNAERTATAVEGAVPAYQVVDFSAGYRYKWLQLEFSCNNLLNQQYFTRRAESYPGPGIIPADGRAFFVTVGVEL